MLQTDAWAEIPSASMRREQLPFHVGMVLLTSANDEARRMQHEQLRIDPATTAAVLPRNRLLDSFAELGVTMRATPQSERSQVIQEHLENLWLRPERFLDTQIIATIGKLATKRQLPGLSNVRAEQLTRIVPFALAVQGVIAAKLPQPEIKPSASGASIPTPRSSVRYATSRNPHTGRTSVSSVQY